MTRLKGSITDVAAKGGCFYPLSAAICCTRLCQTRTFCCSPQIAATVAAFCYTCTPSKLNTTRAWLRNTIVVPFQCGLHLFLCCFVFVRVILSSRCVVERCLQCVWWTNQSKCVVGRCTQGAWRIYLISWLLIMLCELWCSLFYQFCSFNFSQNLPLCSWFSYYVHVQIWKNNVFDPFDLMRWRSEAKKGRKGLRTFLNKKSLKTHVSVTCIYLLTELKEGLGVRDSCCCESKKNLGTV